ncbi:MAG: hypothetical protein LBR34_04395 [Prevotella sp.]|nr:hypothetical protein [Prevotella sp.]
MFANRRAGKELSASYEGFCRRWGWYKVVADLAEDKVLLFDRILEKPVVEIFGFLLYRLEKARAAEENH